MLWIIDGEEYVFDTWEELGTSLRDLGQDGRNITIACGSACEECGGKGLITAFIKDSMPVFMECAVCNATGIKH